MFLIKQQVGYMLPIRYHSGSGYGCSILHRTDGCSILHTTFDCRAPFLGMGYQHNSDGWVYYSAKKNRSTPYQRTDQYNTPWPNNPNHWKDHDDSSDGGSEWSHTTTSSSHQGGNWGWHNKGKDYDQSKKGKYKGKEYKKHWGQAKVEVSDSDGGTTEWTHLKEAPKTPRRKSGDSESSSSESANTRPGRWKRSYDDVPTPLIESIDDNKDKPGGLRRIRHRSHDLAQRETHFRSVSHDVCVVLVYGTDGRQKPEVLR